MRGDESADPNDLAQIQTSRVTELTRSLRNSILDLSRLIYQAKDKYEARHFRKKLWEWLVRFFEALANALGFARHGIAAAIGGAGIIGASVGASRQSLVTAASAVCKEMKDSSTPPAHLLRKTHTKLENRWKAGARLSARPGIS